MGRQLKLVIHSNKDKMKMCFNSMIRKMEKIKYAKKKKNKINQRQLNSQT